MAVRLPREDTVIGALAVYAGGITIVGAVVFGALSVAVDVEMAAMALGLALLGAGWVVRGQHRRRRPPCHVLVDDTEVRLLPEGARYRHDELDPLKIVEWSFSRVDSMGVPRTVTRAAVRSFEPAVELYRTGDRAGCEAWLARYSAARSGAEPTPPSALDRALEMPSSAAVGAATGVTLVAGAGLAAAYAIPSPSWAVGAGAGVMVMATVVAWSTLDRRRLALATGAVGGLILGARPFVDPVFMGGDALGLFAEMHLGFLAGGVLTVVYALAGTRAPRLVG